MPRVSVYNAKFTPANFEEYLRPAEAYVNTYNTLTSDIDTTKGIIDTIPQFLDENNAGDKELLDRYTAFQGDMDAVASAIATGNLRDMMSKARGLKERYNKELAPIATAYNQKQAAIKAYDEKRAKDQSWIGADPRSRSVKDYMNGANPADIGVSGDALYNEALKDAAAQSSRKVNVSNWNLDKNLRNQYFSKVIQTGFNSKVVDDAAKAISENSNVSEGEAKEVFDYMKSAMQRIGGQRLARLNDNDQILANSRILNGLLAGIGYKYDDDKVANRGFMTALEAENARRLRILNDAAEDEQNPETPNIPLRSVEHYSITGNTEKEEELKDLLSRVRARQIRTGDKTGKFIDDEEKQMPTAYSAFAVPSTTSMRREETYGDRILRLSKELGLTDDSISLNAFKQAATPEAVNGIIDALEDTIAKNSVLYRQYYVPLAKNDVDSKFIQNINSHNASFTDKDSGEMKPKGSSLIYKVKSNGQRYAVARMEAGGNPHIPLPGQGTDIMIPTTDGVYYVSPSVYADETVTLGNNNVSVQKGIELYQQALTEGDFNLAGNIAKAIAATIGGTTEGFRQEQGNTVPSIQLASNTKD